MSLDLVIARTGFWMLLGLSAQIRMATTESPATFFFALATLGLSAVALFLMAYPRSVRIRGR